MFAPSPDTGPPFTERLRAALVALEPHPGTWRNAKRCPAHDDQRASLSCTDTGTVVLVSCKAGCSQEAVLEALLGPRARPYVNGQAAAPPRQPYRQRADHLAYQVGAYWHVRTPDKRMWWVDQATMTNGLTVPAEQLPLYGPQPPAGATVVLTEGEKDCDAVLAAGGQALATVTGASGTPSDDSLAVLRGRRVVLWPDHDQPGRDHMARIAGRLAGQAELLLYVHPDDAPKGAGAADVLAPGRTAHQLHAAAQEPAARPTAELLAALERARPARAVDPQALAECVATFQRWLYMPDAGAVLVTLAAVAANRGDGDPLWLMLIGPPGGGKTEALQALVGLPQVYQVATLTEPSLLSGTPAREKATDAKGGLLRVVGDFGIVVCKDFTSVLSMNRDARAATMAALREVYDGSWTRYVGTDGGRALAWSGKVGLLAGCTPIIDSHHAVVGAMGERFVFYRLPPADDDDQSARALAHVGKERLMRAELSAAVRRVLDNVDQAALVAPPDATALPRLVALATLAARCRSAVERDGRTREVELVPAAEAPTRLAKVLLRLLNGLRAIGCDQATAWQLTAKAALDSMPALRWRALEYLAGHGTAASTGDVAEAVAHPTVTVRRTLEDLHAHGVLNRLRQGQGKPDLWELTAWARSRWGTVSEMLGGPYVAVVPPPIDNPHRVFDDISDTPPDHALAELANDDNWRTEP